MSFVDSAKRFARQGARHNTDVQGGDAADGSADAFGNNLQLASGRKFRAAFATFATRRDIEINGFLVDCHAAVSIPVDLGITLVMGDDLTYLPEKRIYRVAEVRGRDATRAETRYALRRLE